MDPNTQRELFSYALLIGYFYLNLQVLIPRLYFSRKYWLFAGATFVGLLVITFVPSLTIPMHPPAHMNHGFGPPPPPALFIMFEIGHNLFIFLIVVFASLTWKISQRWKEVEQQRTSSELAYLKAQVNPHFLFNTLNSIYALALQGSALTADSIVKLSNMMRYITTEANRDLVPLEKELNYIRNYVDLQLLRMGSTLRLNFNIDGNSSGRQIAPLLLIVFVENAFKYGVNPEQNSKIDLNISIRDHQLLFDCVNTRVRIQPPMQPGAGSGIANVRNRLEMQYPVHLKLVIQDQADIYSVHLEIALL